MRTALILTCLAPLTLTAAAGAAAKPPDGIRILDRVAAEPILVIAADGTSLEEVFNGWMDMFARFAPADDRAATEERIAEMEQKLGCAFRKELLGRMGPEYAFVLDLPPIDQLMGAVAGGPQAIVASLTNLGLLATVREPAAVDVCLRKLLAGLEARTFDEEGWVRVELPAAGNAEAQPASLYYGISDGVLALGTSPEFVRGARAPRPAGARLADAADFARVFAHLDRSPTSLTYVNLPKAREMVQASRFIQSLLAAKPELQRTVAMFLSPEYTATGLGTTSVSVDGGTRGASYGPPAMSGALGGVATTGIIAAIAIPNLLNAIDRGKQKRTMADIRSAATAIEAYSIDHDVYPGPTTGWVPLETLAGSVSPTYIRTLAAQDGWGHALQVWSDGQHYAIASPGKDGEMERDWRPDSTEGGPMQSFTADIVFGDGVFVQWPEGAQD